MNELIAPLLDRAVGVLALKMAGTAAFVVLIALLSEKAGVFLGAMVVSLPVFTGPLYVLLALEHDDEYLRDASLGSLGICAITPLFAIAYAQLAQKRGVVLSLLGACAF